jgi:prepilin-type N-terminal cleavage/methylation domain-containing protein
MLSQDSKQQRATEPKSPTRGSRGFTIIELLIGVFVASILTAIAIPVFNSAMTNSRMNSMVSAITGTISSTRYQALMKSQIYTVAITAPANTYVVTNVTTNTAAPTVPLPTTLVLVNGGAGTSTFTLCPNGVIYGAGGSCASGSAAPPAISISSGNRQINMSISSVGNVSTTIIH